MRAVTFADGQPVVEELSEPEPGHRQLLVRVASAGLNGADVLQASGGYPPPPGAPDTPGLEIAGTVVTTGPGCLTTSVGDAVMAVVQGGGHAEFCIVDEELAMPVPDATGLDIAGALPEAFATAHDALFSQADLGMGERVCIHGAAGGVGSAAVQLAAAAGARVTATVRATERHADVAALGATVITPDQLADAGPFDVILELVGAPNWPANLDALALEGRIVVIGVGAGARIDLDLFALMLRRGRIFASTLRARPLDQRARVARRLERHALPLFDDGHLHVPVAESFPLERAADAYRAFGTPGKFGKVVLRPDQKAPAS